MRKEALLIAPLLLVLLSQACAGQENLTLDDIRSLLDNLWDNIQSEFSSLGNQVILLWQKVVFLENYIDNTNARISSIIDLLNLAVPSFPQRGVSVYLILYDGGLSIKQVSQGIENILSTKVGVAILQVKQPNGLPASGVVRITPPVSDNFLLGTLGGQFSYTMNLSNGMAMLNLFTEGLWMVSVENTGYPTFTFFLRVEKEQEQPQTEQVFINTVGTFSKGKPCIIRVTDFYGKTLEGTIRILDTGNPLGVVEGPNPMPYTPQSSSISVSFLRGGQEVASRTFSEVSIPAQGRKLPWIWIAVASACLAVLLLSWRMGWFKKIVIPR